MTVYLCDICTFWAGPFSRPNEHHERCPLNPDLAPQSDGSCHCGSTVISTDTDGCLFCGGWTQEQMDAYLASKQES